MQEVHHIESQDDTKEPVRHLVRNRLPWLFAGLVGGIFTSIIVEQFEAIIARDVRLAFFIPVIVYLSDAVGTQTETIYIRNLKGRHPSKLFAYFIKETLVGLSLGTIFGITLGLFAMIWLKAPLVGLTIAIATIINITIAPVLAVAIPVLLDREHADPALGAGPFSTILSDLISLLVYFGVATLIIL